MARPMGLTITWWPSMAEMFSNLALIGPTLFSSSTLGPGQHLGITYDPFNNSLWIADWNRSLIIDYALDGTLRRSTSLPWAWTTPTARSGSAPNKT